MKFLGEKVSVREELYNGDKLLTRSHEPAKIIGEVEVIHESRDGQRTLFTRTIRENDLLTTGSVFMTEKINGFRSTFLTTPIDVELGVHANTEIDNTATTIPKEIICGLMVGNGGAGDTYNTVRKVRRANRMVPGALPFRVVPTTSDLNATERAKYILRKVKGSYIYYYGKRPDSTPTITVAYEDGTVVPTNVGDTTVDKFIRVYTTYRFTVNKYDIREYFKFTQGSTLKSLINSAGLIAGYNGGNAVDGYPEYHNVRGITTLNMENQELKDSESKITFIYRLFIQ